MDQMDQTRPSRGYYLVRIHDQGNNALGYVVQRGVVAIGWSHTRFTDFSDVDALIGALRGKHGLSGRHEAQIRRFASIREGDRVIIPFGSAIALATSRAERLHDPSVAGTHDLSNQIRVEYLISDGEVARVPRKELSEAFQRRLRVPGSIVLDLREFAEDVERLFSDPNLTWETHHAATEESLQGRFERELLNSIRRGSTNLKAGGLGLEELVQELLQIEGYDARVLAKQALPTGADADIVATREDPLGKVEHLVQVKHHQGETGTWGALQLLSISQHTAEYEEHTKTLVTTADASVELRRLCQEQRIGLIDGEGLVRWITHRLPELSDKTRVQLGISAVPYLTQAVQKPIAPLPSV